MSLSRKLIKCEICQERTSRNDSIKRRFMAKFPLDEVRCKEWVKIVGKEDLIYLPIEKLNKLKYVCEKHFSKKDFNKKHTRLKKTAIPSKNLTALSLPEELFQEFPLHINPVNYITRKRVPISLEPSLKPHLRDHHYVKTENKVHLHEMKKISEPGKQPISANSSTAAENDNETIEAITVEDTQDCQEDDDVVLEDQTYEVTQSENDVPDQSETNLHVGYKCNVCDSVIKGFRYVCVQCVDWDMCSGCEAKAAHSHHYVLRVPGPRPLNEIQPILERIRRELMELSVFIQDSIKQENDLGDQMDPLQEEVNSIGVVNTLPDIEDEQMNSTLIFDNIDHFASDNEVTNDTKQITTKISSVLPSTSNITKSKISAKNITNMETSGSSANNVTKSDGSVRPSAKYIVKCDSSVRPITRVANLQKSKFHIKKLTSKEHFSGNLKIINSKSFVKVERSDLKRILSHIRSQSTKNNE